jgi:tight adherence protein C
MTDLAHMTIHIGRVPFNPLESGLLFLAILVGLWSLLHLWRISRQEERQARVNALRGSVLRPDSPARPKPQRWYGRLGVLLAASPMIGTKERVRLQALLAAAGLKGQNRLATMVASKALCGLLLAMLTVLYVQWGHVLAHHSVMRVTLALGLFMLGWRLPDVVVGRIAAHRRQRFEAGIPDAIDILVMCSEAGLSLEQGMEEIARSFRSTYPELAEEFSTTVAEMRVVAERAQALESMVNRSGISSLRTIMATLTQSVRYGTPLSESLRILAGEMRSYRMTRLEERAARLPVLLTMPLMVFIMPSLIIVIGTPLALHIVDQLSKITTVLP